MVQIQNLFTFFFLSEGNSDAANKENSAEKYETLFR